MLFSPALFWVSKTVSPHLIRLTGSSLWEPLWLLTRFTPVR